MSSSNNGTPRMTVWIRGPASITFSEVSSRVHAPLQRVATSVRTLRTPSRESTRQLDIESGVGQGDEVRIADKVKGGGEADGTRSVEVVGRNGDTVTSTPSVEGEGPAETQLNNDRDIGTREPTQTLWDRLCDFFHGFPEHIATVVWRTVGVAFRKAFLASLANTLCGLFLLGLAKGRDGVYANVPALSVVVACACGSGIVAGRCGVLMFVFGTGKGMTETIEEIVQLSCVFIPAIAVGVTRGHIRALSPAFTAIDALKVGGAGLGGFLVCYSLYILCIEIETMLKSPKTAGVES